MPQSNSDPKKSVTIVEYEFRAFIALRNNYLA